MKKIYLLLANQPPLFLIAAVLLLLLRQCSSAYTPTDEIFLSCGSTNDTSIPGRTWIGDNGTKYSPLDNQKSLTSEARDVGQVPYTTARLSRSEFSYSFPVTTSGPKFVRLYFYPYNYTQKFSRTDAIFSVTSGRFVLLRNFTAFLVADYLGNPSFSREFCVVVDDNKRLNLTFTPSTDSSNAYALINGIEIVSMPADLYYGGNNATNGSRDLVFLGNDDIPLKLSYNNALETVYRINVGGNPINPDSDTGMSRSWMGQDGRYLTEDLSSIMPVNTTIDLVFNDIPNYMAPENVYRTARSMGTNRTINFSYNLTWAFEVDPKFKYMVRLHFCESQSEITSAGDRDFEIFIDSLLASPRADVILWTGGRGIPTYRDYAIYMFAPFSKKINLSVALHPGHDEDSVYADALLNGVEIFKISGHDGNLAGPNPDSTRFQGPLSRSRGISKKMIAGIAGASVFCAYVLINMCFPLFRREGSSIGKASNSVHIDRTHNSSVPAELCRHFSLAEIKAATNGFDESFIVGAGGFGNVYKGYVHRDSMQVAIKRLNPGSQQGPVEFMTEIEMLSKLRHLHLVSLIGCCHDGGEMILVYDYMSRGTLREHLYNTGNPPLSWKKRLKICLGAARGLQYLHMGTKNMIIHRDIKTTNILLDEKWVAKVSDFGLSKMSTSNMSKSYFSTLVKGTFGYLDPEYFRFHRLTEKSDVYSFGVVLFEVLCARPPVNTHLDTDQISLALWVQSCYQNDCLDLIIDPKLKDEIAPECLKKFAETAMSCLHDHGTQRPSMNDIVRSLELALQLQERAHQEITALEEPALEGDRRPGEEDIDSSSSDMESNDKVLGSVLSIETVTPAIVPEQNPNGHSRRYLGRYSGLGPLLGNRANILFFPH